jgi:hypothetical protein
MATKTTAKKRDKEIAKKTKAQAKRARKLERRRAAAKALPNPGAPEIISPVAEFGRRDDW